MCSTCAAGHFSIGGLCLECPANGRVVEFFAISAVACVFVVMTRAAVLYDSMGAFLSFAQTIMLTSFIDLHWPKFTTTVLQGFSFVLFPVSSCCGCKSTNVDQNLSFSPLPVT